MQLTNVDVTLADITGKKFREFLLVQIEKKTKMDPVDTLIIRSQQDFELHDQLNPIEIKIDNNQIINILKK